MPGVSLRLRLEITREKNGSSLPTAAAAGSLAAAASAALLLLLLLLLFLLQLLQLSRQRHTKLWCQPYQHVISDGLQVCFVTVRVTVRVMQGRCE